ncbi:MAG: hypothetical protein LJE69_14190 [Thiohalocapsa sp.]|jgi:hypothetical protein|uniref:hypothetical protein n=1 Tax=Thiohalocapsa sp. TaxID=2497641 RepID=UPI0025FB3D1E|nr:hypothetical protein [Thiohalocapsa sp.]MCG6942387.1 hypothetical protein [Thiohalocapsa sp.]
MAKPGAVACDEPAAPSRRWTLDGDAAVEARIAADQRLIARAVTAAVPAEHLVALVLMGGYGRGEGGFVLTADGPAPFNDYDYFVVVQGTTPTIRAGLQRTLADLAHDLEPRVGVEVDFALLRAERLPRAELSLMHAEMRWGHRVVAGDERVLDATPDMPFRRLPPGELTRLLLNRGALLLLNRRRLNTPANGGGKLDAVAREVFFKYLFKAVLACGDARLGAAGRYHPSYPTKLERLEDLAARDGEDGGDGDLLALYRLAYRHKFRPAFDELSDAVPAQWQARVLEVWLETLRAFEAHRLGRAVTDWRRYCGAGTPKGQRSTLVRSVGVTLRDFGVLEPLRRPRRTLRYPRERLIGALPLLLTSPGNPLEHCVAEALGLPAETTWQQAAERFLALWGRYA